MGGARFPLESLCCSERRGYFLQLAAICDDDTLGSRSRLSADRFDLLHNLLALSNSAENDMLAIQPGCLGRADEELRSVGVRACVSHRQDQGAGMLKSKVLVGEFFSIDGLASSAVMVGEISTLLFVYRQHKNK